MEKSPKCAPTSRSTIYRQELKKNNPEKYKLYLAQQREANKRRRNALKKELSKRHPSDLAKEKYQKELELQRKRQHKYLAKKKQNDGKLITSVFKIPKPKTRKSTKEKREYNRIMKAHSRSKMTPQKKSWERKKDRDRKKRKSLEKKQLKDMEEKGKNVLNDGVEKRKFVNQSITSVNKKLSRTRKCARALLEKVLKRHRQSKINVQKIHEFYMRPDISRLVPHKRYATKEGPGYLMQMSLSAAWIKYVEENGKVVSFGKFAALRPRFVRKLSTKHREYCVCVYCMNIKFKMIALSKQQKKIPVSEYHLADMLLCSKPSSELYHRRSCIDGTCEKCVNYLHTLKLVYSEIPEATTISWSRWERTVKDGRTRRECVTKFGRKEDLLEEMLKDIKTPAMGVNFFQHLHTAAWQNTAFANLKATLPQTWTLSVMDFAKNRALVYQDEIKSTYYSQESITMHPIVTYYNTAAGVVRDSCIVISEDLVHDYHAVYHYQKIVEQHVEGKIEKIDRKVIFSDGCSSQYKSKGPFADLALETMQVDRNFFGSEHGKSDCDAETGVVNKAMDRAIIGRKVVLNCAADMYKYCKDNLSLDRPLSKRHFFFVKQGEIKRERTETQVKTVPNSRKIHQIVNDENSMTLKSRNLSCFCLFCQEDKGECTNSQYIDAYKTEKLVPVPLKKGSVGKEELSRPVPPPKFKKTEELDLSLALTSGMPEEREVFIGQIYKFLECSKNFEELLLKSITAEKELQRYPIKGSDQVSVLSGYFTADSISVELLGLTEMSTVENAALPVSVYGDGNCLPRTGSIFAFGNETHFKEMRLRIIVEMCIRKDLYLDNNYLCKGCEFDDSEKTVIAGTYAMFSEFYSGDILTSVAIGRIYEKEAFEGMKSGTYMGIWQLFALSSVLKCKIRSVYPPGLGSPVVRLHLDRIILPFEEECATPLTILWTSTRSDLPAVNWNPNHFVPVLPLGLTVTEDDGKGDDDDDDYLVGGMGFDDSLSQMDDDGFDINPILQMLHDNSEDDELGKAAMEQGRADVMPGRADVLGRADMVPGRLDVEPGRADSAGDEPARAAMEQGRTDVPGRAEPGRADMVPGRFDVVPGRADSSGDESGRAAMEQGKADVPGRAEQGRADTVPGRVDVVPGRADVVPGRAESSSGDEPGRNDMEPRADMELGSADMEPSVVSEYCVGSHVLVKHGSLCMLPAVVTDFEDQFLWVRFYSREGRRNWCLNEEEPYTILQKDIVRKLDPPDLVQVGGSRFHYKFSI